MASCSQIIIKNSKINKKIKCDKKLRDFGKLEYWSIWKEISLSFRWLDWIKRYKEIRWHTRYFVFYKGKGRIKVS